MIKITMVGIPGCGSCKLQEAELERVNIPYSKETIPIKDAPTGVYPITRIQDDRGRDEEVVGLVSGEEMIRRITKKQKGVGGI